MDAAIIKFDMIKFIYYGVNPPIKPIYIKLIVDIVIA